MNARKGGEEALFGCPKGSARETRERKAERNQTNGSDGTDVLLVEGDEFGFVGVGGVGDLLCSRVE